MILRLLFIPALLLAAALLFLLTEGAAARIWYVDDDGGQDFRNIGDAVSVAEAGDTIYVYEGTYYENVNLERSSSLRGEGQEKVIIDGGGDSYGVRMSTSTLVEGLTIRNADHGIYVTRESSCTIEDCTIRNATTTGIFIRESEDCVIRNNQILENENGIYLWDADQIEMTGNNIISNQDNGIYFRSGEGNLAQANFISHNEFGIVAGSDGGEAHGNDIFDNENGGLSADSGFDATGNWWGDDLGPYHETRNPDGKGDEVFGEALFDPWTMEMKVHNQDSLESYRTIQEALNDASPGDTIRVWEGTFIGDLKIYKSLNLIGNGRSTVLEGEGTVLELVSDNCSVQGFNITKGGIGIGVYGDDNFISECSVSGLGTGIHLPRGERNRVENISSSSNNGYGILVAIQARNSFVVNNSCQKNGYGGIKNSGTGNILTNNRCLGNFGPGIRVDGEDTLLKGNNCSFNSVGMELENSNILVLKNQIHDNSYGIRVANFETDIVIRSNTITGSRWEGIRLSRNRNIRIEGNNICRNNNNGISLLSCQFITIRNNSFEDDCLRLWGAELEEWNSHDIEGNIIDEKPLYFYKNRSDFLLPEDSGQVILANCSNGVLQNLDFQASGDGALLGYCNNISILDSNFVDLSGYGAHIFYADNITISRSRISNTRYGLRFYESKSSTIRDCTISRNQPNGVSLELCQGTKLLRNSISESARAGIEFSWSTDNLIKENSLLFNKAGIEFSNDCHNSTVYGNTIWQNTNHGIYNHQSELTIHATNNWWGHSSGPYHTVGNPSGQGDTISGDVLYTPWHTQQGELVHNIDQDLSYQTIQEALNDAAPGDTIRVFSGVFHENLMINKTLTLMGNDSSSTRIYGDDNSSMITVLAPWVNISGFGLHFEEDGPDTGIYVEGDHLDFHNNWVETNASDGLWLQGSSWSRVENNSFTVNGDAIYLSYSNNCSINNNSCQENRDNGLLLFRSKNNTIQDNLFQMNGQEGATLRDLSNNNRILGNHFGKNGYYGLRLLDHSSRNLIQKNIFEEDIVGLRVSLSENNTFLGNRITGTVLVDSSQDTLLQDNRVFPSQDLREATIVISYSENSSLQGNEVTAPQGRHAIYFQDSRGDWLRDNRLHGGGIYGDLEIPETWLEMDLDISNTLDGGPVCIYGGRSGVTVPEDAAQVLLYQCQDMVVRYLDISSQSEAVLIVESRGVVLEKNTLFNCGYGIRVVNSTDCRILSNNCNGSRTGISLESSSGCVISDNNCSWGDLGILLLKVTDTEISRNQCHFNRDHENMFPIIFLADFWQQNPELASVWDSGHSGIIENPFSQPDDWEHFSGIHAEEVSRLEIHNNSCHSNRDYGIWMEEGRLLVLENNSCQGNQKDGLRGKILDKCWFNDTICDLNGVGMNITICQNSHFLNTRVSKNSYFQEEGRGLLLRSLVRNTLVNTTAAGNEKDGLKLLDSHFNIFSGGLFSENREVGIFLDSSQYNDLENIICQDNEIVGLAVVDSANNDFTKLQCLSNWEKGVWLESSTNNEFADCLFNDNGDVGVRIYSSTFSNFTGCSFNDNAQDGVRLVGCHDNFFDWCNITGNNFGIKVIDFGVLDAFFHNCSITNNQHGASVLDWNQIHAEYCWWGHSSGPYDSSRNPNGQGDDIEEEVHFIPWKTSQREVSAGILNINPEVALTNEEIHFQCKGSGDGSPVRYLWTLEDETVLYNGSEESFRFQGLPPGDYKVFLRVKDDWGVWRQADEKELTVHSRPEIRSLQISPDPGLEDENIVFRAVGWDDGTYLRYRWWIGEEELYNGTNDFFRHDGLPGGHYLVHVACQDEHDIWSETVVVPFTIHSRPNATIVEILPQNPKEGEEVTFLGKAEDDGEVSGWYWRSSIDGVLAAREDTINRRFYINGEKGELTESFIPATTRQKELSPSYTQFLKDTRTDREWVPAGDFVLPVKGEMRLAGNVTITLWYQEQDEGYDNMPAFRFKLYRNKELLVQGTGLPDTGSRPDEIQPYTFAATLPETQLVHGEELRLELSFLGWESTLLHFETSRKDEFNPSDLYKSSLVFQEFSWHYNSGENGSVTVGGLSPGNHAIIYTTVDNHNVWSQNHSWDLKVSKETSTPWYAQPLLAGSCGLVLLVLVVLVLAKTTLLQQLLNSPWKDKEDEKKETATDHYLDSRPFLPTSLSHRTQGNESWKPGEGEQPGIPAELQAKLRWMPPEERERVLARFLKGPEPVEETGPKRFEAATTPPQPEPTGYKQESQPFPEPMKMKTPVVEKDSSRKDEKRPGEAAGEGMHEGDRNQTETVPELRISGLLPQEEEDFPPRTSK